MDVPDDVWEKALKLASATFGTSDDKDVMEVAAALMAERERCAKIAAEHLDRGAIAAAIRRGAS